MGRPILAETANLALATAGSLVRPFIAKAAAKTATVWVGAGLRRGGRRRVQEACRRLREGSSVRCRRSSNSRAFSIAIFADQRQSEHCPLTAELHRFGPGVFRVGRRVLDVHRAPLEHRSAGQRATARRDRIARLEIPVFRRDPKRGGPRRGSARSAATTALPSIARANVSNGSPRCGTCSTGWSTARSCRSTRRTQCAGPGTS
jgi:hypothetical protein